MRLRDYLQKHQITQASFGQRMRPPVSQGKVNHWLKGSRRVSLAEALQIERITDGEVTPLALLPLDAAEAVAAVEKAAHAAEAGAQPHPVSQA